MHSCVIVPARPEHVAILAVNLRGGDCLEILSCGISAKRAIWRSYRTSVIVSTGYIDGELAAMFGCGGSMLGAVGTPWLLTTPAVERAPLLFVRNVRAEVGKMLELFPRLTGYVADAYPQAVGMLRMVGFTVGEPVPLGPNRAAFREYTMER